MAPRQVVLAQRNFSAGMRRSGAPHEADPRQVWDHINGLYGEDAKPFKRGGSVGKSISLGGVVVRENLATNPSGELVKKFTDNDGTSTREQGVTTPVSFTGEWRDRHVLEGDVGSGIRNYVGAVPFTAPQAGRYVASLYVWIPPGSALSFVRLGYLGFGGSDVLSVQTNQEGEWRRIYRVRDIATDLVGELQITASFVGTPGSPFPEFYTDALQIEEINPTVNTPTTYFDGDTSSAQWAGTPHASVSEFLEAPDAGLTWMEDVYFDAGQRTIAANPSDFAVLGSDDKSWVVLGSDGLSKPVTSAFIEDLLFIGGGYTYGGSRKAASYTTSGGNTNLTNGSKTVTDASGGFTANVDPGMLLQNGNERVYVVASVDSDTQLTLRDAYEGTTTTTANVTLHNIYKITAADPYPDAEIYAVCANRLVYANRTTVAVSEIQKPHDFTATIIGGIPPEVPTEHDLPEGLRITGLGVIAQTLLVFTTAGAWTIDGLAFQIIDAQGNSRHKVQVLSRELILLHATGIATFRQALVVPCTDGIYLLDGISQPEPSSGPIDDLYREYVRSGYRTGNARVYNGHYFLPILNATGTEPRDGLVARMDRPLEIDGEMVTPWSRLTGNGGKIISYATRNLDTPGEPLLLGAEWGSGARVLDCTGYFKPDETNAFDADGSVIDWLLVSRDLETPNGTINMVRKLRSRYELRGHPTAPAPHMDFDYGFGFREEGGFLWDEHDWASSYPDEALEDTPSLYWRLGTGGTDDQTANNRDGTGVGGITIGGQAGALVNDPDGATDFDGTDDRITSAYNPFTIGSVRTFEGWAWRDASATVDTLVGATTGVAGDAVWLRLDIGAPATVRFSTNGGTNNADWTNAWPGNAQWVHWALIFDDANNTAELFINGVSKGVVAYATAYAASPGNVQVGVTLSTTQPWDGKMDEFAVYEGALSPARIAAHYTAGLDQTEDEDDLFWESPDEDVFFQLDCPGPPSNGEGVHRCRINEPTRSIRIRARNSDATTALRLLSLELFTRESRAVRR